MSLLLDLLDRVAGDSREVACKNARVASTELARRNRERREVEEFLARQRQPDDAARGDDAC